MSSKKVLITNDDGYQAHGIGVLHKTAMQFYSDVWVVAPDVNNSGISSSLRPHVPFQLIQHSERVYSVTSTPVVSVNAGISLVLKGQSPDILLSGINRGSNVGNVIHYSGTFGAAMEAIFFGIPAIAFSQLVCDEISNDDNFDEGWAISEKFLPQILPTLVDFVIENKLLLSVNFPKCPVDEVQGVVLAPQTQKLTVKRDVIKEMNNSFHIQDRMLYMGDVSKDQDDYSKLRSGFIVLTPYTLDWNSYGQFCKVAKVAEKLNNN